MKKSMIAFLSVAACALLISVAFGAGNVEKGKALFNDPKLGTTGNTCATCHPDGAGLIGAGEKKELKTPAGAQKTLEEAINVCITMALKGKALDVNSGQMKDLVAYIKSLKAPAPAEAPKKKKPAVGC